MKHSIIQLLIKFVFIVIGILMIGSLPNLFEGMKLNVPIYINGLIGTFISVVHPWDLSYNNNGILYPLVPNILSPYRNSMSILIAAFIVALLASLLLLFIVIQLPVKIREWVKKLLSLFESIPDIFVIVLFQIFVIWFFKKTHILLLNVVSGFEEDAIGLPIICLSILPTFLLLKIFILSIEDELKKTYVEFAKSKGIAWRRIFYIHILKNSLATIFIHSKSILWFMLSNLLVLEYVFNVSGIIFFMYDNVSPEVFTIGLLLMFIPIYILFAVAQLLIEKTTEQKVVM